MTKQTRASMTTKLTEDQLVSDLVPKWIAGEGEAFNQLMAHTYESRFMSIARRLLKQENKLTLVLPTADLVNQVYENMVSNPPNEFIDVTPFWRWVEKRMRRCITQVIRHEAAIFRGGPHKDQHRVSFTKVEGILEGKGGVNS